ncbi:MAG: hypothetical protein DKINENOH_00157 [bacterium]|nr:hypothetical protein [bacterium]
MKTIRLLSVLLMLSLLSAAWAQGPGSAGALFLLIQPSLRANGMGGASVSSVENDALGIMFNPARLGMAAGNNHFIVEFYPDKTIWLGALAPDISYDAKSFLGGYSFKTIDNRIPVSVGIGYSRITLDYGDWEFGSEIDPTPISVFHAVETVRLWTVGLSVDYGIKAGFGWGFKSIESNLGPAVVGSQIYAATAESKAHDFGVVLYAPGEEIIARLTGKTLELRPGVRPVFGVGLGYSKSNIGDAISYIDAAQADPLPRTARVGLSLNAGLTSTRHGRPWRLVSLEHQYEAEQLLVRRVDHHSVTYAHFLGDISFFKNVILRQENAKIITKAGWELGANESIFLRYGRYRDPLGRVEYNTFGASISSYGLLNVILEPSPQSSYFIRLITEHIELCYDYGKYDVTGWHPLSGTDFHGVRIRLF